MNLDKILRPDWLAVRISKFDGHITQDGFVRMNEQTRKDNTVEKY